eukprot:g16824.t1
MPKPSDLPQTFIFFLFSVFAYFFDSLDAYGSYLRCGLTLFANGGWIEALPLLECESLVPKHLFLLGLTPPPLRIRYEKHENLSSAIIRGLLAACCVVVPGLLLSWACLPFWSQSREVLLTLRPKIARLHACMAGFVGGATVLLMLQAVNRHDGLPASFKAAIIVTIGGVRYWVQSVKERHILVLGGLGILLWHVLLFSILKVNVRKTDSW